MWLCLILFINVYKYYFYFFLLKVWFAAAEYDKLSED